MNNEFRANEIGTDAEDTKYENWIHAVGKELGREIEMGSQLESDLFPMYEANFKTWEATLEIQTVEEQEAERKRAAE